MKRLRLAGLSTMGIVCALALTAAQRPSVFAQAASGVWEVTGLPGAGTRVRQCVADVSMLARFEHRSKNCSQRITSDAPSSVVIDYSCGGAGFGHSKVDMITPRSLRIETQGISDKLPFSYVLQARRVGDCPTIASAPRH